MRYYFSVLFILLSVIAQAGTIDPNVPDQKYLDYGAKFGCVVRICGQSDDNIKYCASAVVLNKHWIITAAHVVEKCTSAHITYNDKDYCLDKIIIHSQFKEDAFGFYDIALGYSKEEINCDFFPELYTNTDEVGKICAMAGYGITGNFNTGTKTSDGKKRGGSNIIDKIDRGLLICSPSRNNDSSRTALEFLIGHGDSGGGLFIDKKLAGINSCVLASDNKPNSTYTDESGHTRISLYIDWIKKHINKKIDEFDNDKIISFNALPVDNTIYYIVLGFSIGLNFVCFALGYLWCNITMNKNSNNDYIFAPSNRSGTKDVPKKLATIDNSKVVVSINTDNLEKKYTSLGETKTSGENITESINKLKNLKG